MVTPLNREFNESYPDVYYDPDLNSCFSVDFFNKTAKIFFDPDIVPDKLEEYRMPLAKSASEYAKKGFKEDTASAFGK